jgi:putative addiction module killer protein
MPAVREFVDARGSSPYKKWFDGLNAPAAATIATALTRLALGNYSNVKSVGAGVFEVRIFFGPGYRVYFGNEGEKLVILLGGGSKQRQRRDINAAIANWQNYKARK